MCSMYVHDVACGRAPCELGIAIQARRRNRVDVDVASAVVLLSGLMNSVAGAGDERPISPFCFHILQLQRVLILRTLFA